MKTYPTFCFSCLLILLFCSTNAFAQKWANGYVVHNDGDTIYGYIYKDWKGDCCVTSKKLLFRKTPQSPTELYVPADVQAFNIDKNEYYISSEVRNYYNPRLDSINNNQPSQVNGKDIQDCSGCIDTITVAGLLLKPECWELKTRYDSIFLHVLLKGEYVSLYETGGEHPRFYGKATYTILTDHTPPLKSCFLLLLGLLTGKCMTIIFIKIRLNSWRQMQTLQTKTKKN